MAITGAHALLYTSEPEQVRAILRDVFGFSHVDAGDGWLIFALPPAEVGVHPVAPGTAASHELSFTCDDIEATVEELRAKGLTISQEPTDEGFGIVARLLLPGDLAVLVYQPRHPLAT